MGVTRLLETVVWLSDIPECHHYNLSLKLPSLPDEVRDFSNQVQ